MFQKKTWYTQICQGALSGRREAVLCGRGPACSITTSLTRTFFSTCGETASPPAPLSSAERFFWAVGMESSENGMLHNKTAKERGEGEQSSFEQQKGCDAASSKKHSDDIARHYFSVDRCPAIVSLNPAQSRSFQKRMSKRAFKLLSKRCMHLEMSFFVGRNPEEENKINIV